MASSPSSPAPPKLVSSLVETTSTSVQWYEHEPGARLTDDVLAFFYSYCGLVGNKLLQQLLAVHARAWATRPYPCVGQWGFLQPKITKSPAYDTVIQRLKDGHMMLDLGCCMGQDLRRLAAAGAPTDKMYGSDIEPVFWDLGYDLFCDRDKFQGQFICADIFDNESPLAAMKSKFDVVYVGSVLHLWDWKGQVDALKAIVALSKVGSLVLACQLGRAQSVEVASGWNNKTKTMFMHDAQTVHDLWLQVAHESDTEWEVEARTVELEILLPEKRDRSWMSSDARGLLFEAIRKR